MPISKSRIQTNYRYNAKTYDQLRASYRKEYKLKELVRVAAVKRGLPSDAAYIVAAVRAALDADEITLEDLPAAAPQDEKQPDEE